MKAICIAFIAAGCSTNLHVPRSDGAWAELGHVLPGTWTATSQSGTNVTVSFRWIANATVLAETFGRPEHETMTLYHLDHGALMATHYCAQGNQPRLRAAAVAPHAITLRFADVTDRDPSEAMLVELDYELAGDRFDRIEVYRQPDGTLERTRWHFTRA